MTEVIDAKWFEQYQAIRPRESVGVVFSKIPDEAAQRASFMGNQFENNPSLEPQIDLNTVKQQETDILRFREDLVDDDPPPVVLDAYLPLVNNRLNACELQRAAAQGDVERAMEAMNKRFGTVNSLAFGIAAQYFRELATTHRYAANNVNIEKAAGEVLHLVADPAVPEMGIWPNQTEFDAVKLLHADLLNAISSLDDLPETLSGREALYRIRKVVKESGYPYYVMARGDGRKGMQVRNKTEEWLVPTDTEFDARTFRGRVLHELRHIKEDIEGRKLALRIVTAGLHKYARASEGKGVMAEQATYGGIEDFIGTEQFFKIARLYLSIGVALGIDGQKPRDFQQVFEIIHAVERLRELIKNPDEPIEASKKAADATWTILTKRTLMGMVGSGYAYTYDKGYLEGNLLYWHLLKKHPGVYQYIDLGKYDITNADHVHIMKDIGAIPADFLVDKTV